MASFDPYHKWLGIPPADQPPSHYRLLGIPELESDPDVIDGAAEQRTIFLRTFQAGDQAELAEQLLNEVSAARVCLLDGKAKAMYDKRLKAELDSAAGSAALANISLAVESGSQRDQGRRSGSSAPLTWYQTPWAAAAAGAVVMLLLMLLFWPSGADTKSPGKTDNSQTQQQMDALKQKLATAERAAKVTLQTSATKETGPLQDAARATMEKAASEKMIAESVVPLAGHEGPVRSVAFSPDGKRIASGSNDNSVKVWNAETRELVLTLDEHTAYVTSVAFSPDGTQVVSGSADGAIKVWNAETGLKLWDLKRHSKSVECVVFSPVRKQLISSSRDKTIRLWNTITGQEIRPFKGQSGTVYLVAFSPDGTRVATGSSDHMVKVWDVATGEVKLILKGHSGSVGSVTFSPDGKRIISGSNDTTVKVWDANTSEEIRTLNGHSREVFSVAFSPDGNRIVSGSVDKTVKVWDAETSLEILTIQAHEGPVNSVSFSPDGKRVVSGSNDGMVKIWNLGSAPAQPVAKTLPAIPLKPKPSKPTWVDEGLVAYYPFNGDAEDKSGNGHHGNTTAELVFTSDRRGSNKQALGSEQVITIPDHDDLDLGSTEDGELTISLWFKAGGGNFIGKSLKSKTDFTSRNIDYRLFVSSPTEGFSHLGWGTGPANEYGGSILSWTGIWVPGKDDSWHHLVATCSSPIPPEPRWKAVFFDGGMVYRAPIGKKNGASNNPVQVGAARGHLDDIRIYNRALSDAEVKELYEYEKAAPLGETSVTKGDSEKMYPFLPDEVISSSVGNADSFKFRPESDEIGNGKGEFGGKLARSTKRFEYSVSLGAKVPVKTPLYASGKLVVTGQNDLDLAFYLCHFSSTDETARIGFQFGHGSQGPIYWNMVCGQAITYCRSDLEKTRVLTWKYAWLPDQGDYGFGLLRWELDNKKWELHFREMPLSKLATVDRFGIVKPPSGSGEPKNSFVVFYLDDVQYSDVRP